MKFSGNPGKDHKPLWLCRQCFTRAASTFCEICDMLQTGATTAHHCNFLPVCPGLPSEASHDWVWAWPPAFSPDRQRGTWPDRGWGRGQVCIFLPEVSSPCHLPRGRSSVSICTMLRTLSGIIQGPLVAIRCTDMDVKTEWVGIHWIKRWLVGFYLFDCLIR